MLELSGDAGSDKHRARSESITEAKSPRGRRQVAARRGDLGAWVRCEGARFGTLEEAQLATMKLVRGRARRVAEAAALAVRESRGAVRESRVESLNQESSLRIKKRVAEAALGRASGARMKRPVARAVAEMPSTGS